MWGNGTGLEKEMVTLPINCKEERIIQNTVSDVQSWGTSVAQLWEVDGGTRMIGLLKH